MVRDVAKKVLFLMETEFDNFFLPPIFGLEKPYFIGKTQTQIKYLPTNFNVICPYFYKMAKVK